MPEYPDITIYIERLQALVKGQSLERIRISSPSLLRTAEPLIETIHGLTICGFERMGKRVIFVLDGGYFLVLHMMINGRLHWRKKGCTLPRKNGLAAFDFTECSLLLTEVGAQKRASLHLLKGRETLNCLDPGGLDVVEASLETFHDQLMRENHTLKRSLTDPKLFSGIGNAYSDEILHRARLSPIVPAGKLSRQDVERLYWAIKNTLLEWTHRIRKETGDKFLERVTAFRDGMAVHGRYGKPCPDCGATVQRIRYASNETNYCPRCQTGGKLLADRALSRLLKKDWPRTLRELEEKRR